MAVLLEKDRKQQQQHAWKTKENQPTDQTNKQTNDQRTNKPANQTTDQTNKETNQSFSREALITVLKTSQQASPLSSHLGVKLAGLWAGRLVSITVTSRSLQESCPAHPVQYSVLHLSFPPSVRRKEGSRKDKKTLSPLSLPHAMNVLSHV